MGILWEIGVGEFLLVTVVLGGGAAWMSGRAVALTWRTTYQLVLYVVLLAVAVRFVHFALFYGSMVAPQYFLVDFVILLGWASLGFRVTRVGQMVGQYRWLYEQSNLIGWRPRSVGAGVAPRDGAG